MKQKTKIYPLGSGLSIGEKYFSSELINTAFLEDR
jgi:hypothetical protein